MAEIREIRYYTLENIKGIKIYYAKNEKRIYLINPNDEEFDEDKNYAKLTDTDVLILEKLIDKYGKAEGPKPIDRSVPATDINPADAKNAYNNIYNINKKINRMMNVRLPIDERFVRDIDKRTHEADCCEYYLEKLYEPKTASIRIKDTVAPQVCEKEPSSANTEGNGYDAKPPSPGRPAENEFFTGRDKELNKLQERFSQGVKVQIIRGMGGMGKTQIALRYSYIHENDYSLIHWINADSINNIVSCYKVFLRRFGDMPDLSDMTQEEGNEFICQTYMDYMETHSGWLIIYDNGDFYSRNDRAFFRNYCIPRGDGHILITSRDLKLSGNDRHIDINEFDYTDAVTFVLGRAESEDKSGAEKLVNRLGCYPLALEIAAAYICNSGWTFEKYLEYLDKDIEILEEVRHANIYSKKGETLKRIVQVTLENICKNENDEHLDQCIKELLYTSAYTFYGGIDLKAYGCYDEKAPYYEMIKTLCTYCKDARFRTRIEMIACDYSLLERNNHFLTIQPLFQEVIRKSICPKGEYAAVVEEVYGALLDGGWEQLLANGVSEEDADIIYDNCYRNVLCSEIIRCNESDSKFYHRPDTPDGLGKQLYIIDRSLAGFKVGLVDSDDINSLVKNLADTYPVGEQNYKALGYLWDTYLQVFDFSVVEGFLELKKQSWEVYQQIKTLYASKYFSIDSTPDSLDSFLDMLTGALYTFNEMYFLDDSMDHAELGLKAIDKYVRQAGTAAYIKEHSEDRILSYMGRFGYFFEFMEQLTVTLLDGINFQRYELPLAQYIDNYNIMLRNCIDATDSQELPQYSPSYNARDWGWAGELCLEDFDEIVEAYINKDRRVLERLKHRLQKRFHE